MNNTLFKKVVASNYTFFCSLIGLIIGGIWMYESNWHFEPLIIFSVSLCEIIGYIIYKELYAVSHEIENPSGYKNKSKVESKVVVNINSPSKTNNSSLNKGESDIKGPSREFIIDSMKSKTHILFIDDDEHFNVVKILKNSGWTKTKSVVDIKSLDIQIVKEADIFFVDINGVGKILGLEFQGLDLSLMLKQKYPEKKVIIYSANNNFNPFHKAWDACDYKLEKNALPYQFQNLVEKFSIEKFNKIL